MLGFRVWGFGGLEFSKRRACSGSRLGDLRLKAHGRTEDPNLGS